MKIKTKLQWIAVLPVAVFIAAMTVQIALSGLIDRRHQREDAASGIVRQTSDLLVLTYEYGVARSDRAAKQWAGQHATLERQLREAASLMDSREERELLRDMGRNHADAGQLFSELLALDAGRDRRPAAAPSAKVRTNLLNTLILELQDILPLAGKLRMINYAEEKRLGRIAAVAVISLLFGLILGIPPVVLVTVRRITGRIDSLLDGMKTVASGNLEHRVRIDAADEISDLARGFNDMTGRLKSIAVSRDELRKEIAERRRTEEALRTSEERTRNLVETTSDWIWEVDADGRYAYSSPQIVRILGYLPAEVIGKTPFDFMPPEERGRVSEAFLSLAAQRAPVVSLENVNRHKNGRLVVLETNGVPFYDAEGTFRGYRGIDRDITERKRNEAASASRLHLVRFSLTHTLDELLEETLNEAEKLTGSLIGFYHFIEDNQKSLRLQNWSTQTKAEFCTAEGKGMHYPIADAGVWADCVRERKPLIHNDYASLPNRRGLPPGHAEVVRELVVPVIRGDKIRAILGVGNKAAEYQEKDVEIVSLLADLAWEIAERKMAEEEVRRLNQDLEQRVSDRTADLRAKSGELKDSQAALMNIVEDLNEKTAELEAANEKLKGLDRLKSLFIASMSHELRTPLNSIIGFSSIMLNEWTGPVTAEQKDNLSAVMRSGKHLLSLINDVIDVSKIEAGKIESVAADFDVRGVVLEAIETLKKEIETKGLELDIRVPRQVLHADRRRLLQCLINLVSNAIKFTNQGSITVSAEPSTAGEMLSITVEDTGIGIREDEIGKLFLPFVRLTPPPGSIIPGSGLGLYLTQKLVREVLKGDILVSSASGVGSRFTLRLPAAG